MTHDERRRRRAAIAAAAKADGPVAAALRFGVTPETVRTACREHGVGMTRAAPSSVSTYEIIGALISTDTPIAAVAAARGLSKQRVHQIYQKCLAAGIPVRTRARGRPKA